MSQPGERSEPAHQHHGCVFLHLIARSVGTAFERQLSWLPLPRRPSMAGSFCDAFGVSAHELAVHK